MPLPRDEGSGGREGTVLNLTMSGDGIWDAVYSVKALVGKSLQPVMLSVDTGSSDVWIASQSCSSPACSGAHTTLYDSSSSSPTGDSFDLQFLRGAVSGPIVWDDFKLGPYLIPSQALAAANQVTDESLSSDFVGLLGLALPPNSKIAQQIPSTETDAPDGATLQMNLFGLTPIETAPEQRFFSLSLERPGTSRIPSLLGIGRHPANLVPGFDPAKVSYAELISTRAGDTFWRVPVMNITAWVDGVPKPIQLGRSMAIPTSMHTVALVDSGGPSILATADIANGIYGAWGIGPGQDGNYYVPCTTPMNISLGLANLPQIPLHPLDITAPPRASKGDTSSTTCLGQIQAITSDKLVDFADIVLGVPFMRNVYTVLSSSSSDDPSALTPGSPNPRLGLLPLTDPATAMSEFHTVRVLGKPLDPSSSPSPENDSSGTVGKKLSVGVTVLVAIVAFFVGCGLLFGARWWLLRRRFARKVQAEQGNAAWAQKKDGQPNEDTLRTQRWEEGKKKGLFYPESSIGSEFSRADQNDGAAKEDGLRASSSSRPQSPVSPSASVVGHAHGTPETESPDPIGWGALHVRTTRDVHHKSGAAAAVPLLDEGEQSPWSDTPPAHERVPSAGSVSFADEAGMAGVGARSSVASSSSRSRPRPRGARAPSGGSISSTASRIWHAEVGQVLEPVEDPRG